MHGFLLELRTTTWPSTSVLSLLFTAFLRVEWVAGFAVWQIVVAALSPHLLNRILFLSFLQGFSECEEFIHTDLTRDEDNVLEGKPIYLFSAGDFCGLKAGMAVFTRQAFPSQGTDPIRESEGCFLVYVSRNLIFSTEEVTSGRRTCRLLILSGYQLQTQKVPTLWPACLSPFI